MRKLLIANRGEIARRVIRTAHLMGLRTVAVYVGADADAPFVGEAGEAYLIPSDSYLDAEAVLDIARRAGADAVHPGYGFLSENPRFATSVVEDGLCWVGPPPAAVAAMGDKLAARELAIQAGVPTLPAVDDPADADRVGFPLIVKASAGGGGKGMRIVYDPSELDEAIPAARREATASFGDGTVFLERYLVRSRHVEIQILGDAHGGLVHLGERECSIQRRHQKIIEESPSPVVDPALRERMGAAAVALAKTLGYSSAGTVEFLVDDNAGPDGERSFYFLEVNTRLQVEHPVTEAVTGLDIVREQLRVAMGEPLGYTQADIVFTGHAIEARLYAEDPVAGFLPATGTLVGWKPASEPPARWDSAVEAGGVIGTQFDPMLAKIIVHAPNRHEAAGRLALVLERSLIAGVVTNRDFLVNTLRTPEFVSGDTTTDFIDRVDPPRRAALRAEVARDAAISAALWQQQNRRSTATVLAFMPSGWRNTPFPLQIAMFTSDGDSVTISYRRRRDGTFTIGDDGCVARVLAWGGTSIDVEIGGHRFRSTIVESGDRLYVATPDGQTELSVCPLFPTLEPAAPSGGVVAPMPGIVLDVRVVSDQRVEAGETLAVMEAMKMEHRLIAPTPGRVTEVRVAIGDRLEAGAILFVVEEETT